MISYAQNFEDVLLDRAFPGRHEGFYVDVGAWHPVRDSVTKHFYDLGWRGINVEPLPEALALFREQRPRDANLGVALGERPGQRGFLRVADTGLSTLELHRRKHFEALGLSCTEDVVEVTTLQAVCHEHVHCEIDFLKIDVEGAEKAVLAGGDWDNFRPRVVLVEAVAADPGALLYPSSDTPRRHPRPTWDDWERDLLARSYRFCLFDGLNRFYVREEDGELAEWLTVPANVLDNFVSSRVVEAEARLEAMRQELQETQGAPTRERREFDSRIACVVAAADEERREIAAQIAALRCALQQADETRLQGEDKLQHLERERDRFRHQAEELERQMAATATATDKERRAVAAQMAALRSALQQAEESWLWSEDKLERVEREREGLRHQTEELERQIAALLASRSWRLTQPLRRLNAWLAMRPRGRERPKSAA
jgi:FkbM family methyltransferase